MPLFIGLSVSRLLHWPKELNRKRFFGGRANVSAVTDVLGHCDLMMYDKQSNSSRRAIQSKSNRSCNPNLEVHCDLVHRHSLGGASCVLDGR